MHWYRRYNVLAHAYAYASVRPVLQGIMPFTLSQSIACSDEYALLLNLGAGALRPDVVDCVHVRDAQPNRARAHDHKCGCRWAQMQYDSLNAETAGLAKVCVAVSAQRCPQCQKLEGGINVILSGSSSLIFGRPRIRPPACMSISSAFMHSSKDHVESLG